MYNLVFSDGTGQRGVRKDGSSTNIHKLYVASNGVNGQTGFYDPGVGTALEESELDIRRKVGNLIAKAAGTGIGKNIRDCYDFLVRAQQPDRRIGLFGFSRGAYTARSVGGVLSLCGLPHADQDGIDLTRKEDPQSIAKRAELVAEAVKIYQAGKGDQGVQERKALSDRFRQKYKCADALPHVVGVFDTVAALGLPGVTNLFNPFRHTFHDTKLNSKVPFGFQALSVDENRKLFAPVLWEDAEPGGDQVIEQLWFPGVHSDVGGGYLDDRLSDFAMSWMAEHCRRDEIGIEFDLAKCNVHEDILGNQHDERTGWGRFWQAGTREKFIRKRTPDDHRLCDPMEERFADQHLNYRPQALKDHPRVRSFYGS